MVTCCSCPQVCGNTKKVRKFRIYKVGKVGSCNYGEVVGSWVFMVKGDVVLCVINVVKTRERVKLCLDKLMNKVSELSVNEILFDLV